MECFGLLLEHLAWIEHQFLSGIRDSRKAGSLRGMMRGVGGVQEEIPREEASTLQIRSVAFPPEQCTSPQFHPYHNLTKMGIKTVPHSPYSPDLAPCDFWLFPKLRGCHYETIEEMKEAVMKVIDTLTQEDFHGAFQKLLEWYNKCIAARGDYFEGDKSFMCVLSIKVPIRIKSGNLFNDPRICIYIYMHICIDNSKHQHLLCIFTHIYLISQKLRIKWIIWYNKKLFTAHKKYTIYSDKNARCHMSWYPQIKNSCVCRKKRRYYKLVTEFVKNFGNIFSNEVWIVHSRVHQIFYLYFFLIRKTIIMYLINFIKFYM